MACGKPYSQDLRKSIINAHKNGISTGKISNSHSIPQWTVQRIINLFKENESFMERKKLAVHRKLLMLISEL